MATPVVRRSGMSASTLVLACVLVLLSLWKVDTGLTARRLTSFERHDVDSTSFRSSTAPDEARAKLYRFLATAGEKSASSSSGDVIESGNEEVRRLTLLSLMVYATGDGIRR
jgi:hypothetical protein